MVTYLAQTNITEVLCNILALKIGKLGSYRKRLKTIIFLCAYDQISSLLWQFWGGGCQWGGCDLGGHIPHVTPPPNHPRVLVILPAEAQVI